MTDVEMLQDLVERGELHVYEHSAHRHANCPSCGGTAVLLRRTNDTRPLCPALRSRNL